MTFWRVKDWSVHFENNRTRDLKRMAWVPMPNKMDGDGYTELLDHPNGTAHFGVWVAIVEIASRCGICPKEQEERTEAGDPAAGCGNTAVGCGNTAVGWIPRGTLIRDNGKPHDFSSIYRLSRIPVDLLKEVIPRLISLGWIEQLEEEIPSKSEAYELPHEGAGIPHEGAGIPHEGGILTCARGTERNGTEKNRKEEHTHTLDASSGVVGKPNGKPARAFASDLNGKTSSRFDEFWQMYPMQVEKDHACSSFVSLVTDENEALVFACLQRYLASDQVSRGVVSKPGVWLEKQHRDKWQSKWPLAKTGTANGAEPQKLTICPRCQKKPCICFELQLAKEREKSSAAV